MPTLVLFQLHSRGTTVSREVRGAAATFLTMAYILLANPSILAPAMPEVPPHALAACTALAAGVCCIAMGLWANFPIALASGMGLNALVALLVLGGRVPAWQVAMGLVVLDGLLVLALVLAGLREAVMDAIPRDLRLAIGAGIGLFIAFIGLVNAGIVVRGPAAPGAPPLMPGSFDRRPETSVALAGLLLTAVLMAWRVQGALVIGILAATAVALRLHVAQLPASTCWAARASPPSRSTSAARFHWHCVPLLLAVIMVDFFDTLGTATAIAEEAGLIGPEGRIPGLRRILIVDSLSAIVGGLLGVSRVTSYIESAAGVAEGARTGTALGLRRPAVPRLRVRRAPGRASSPPPPRRRRWSSSASS